MQQRSRKIAVVFYLCLSAPLALVLLADRRRRRRLRLCRLSALAQRQPATNTATPLISPASIAPIPRAQLGLLPPPGAERPDPRGGVVNPCGRVGVGTRRRLRPPEDRGENRGRRDELRIEQLRSVRGETRSPFLLP